MTSRHEAAPEWIAKTARAAWDACDDRKLSTDEKIALLCDSVIVASRNGKRTSFAALCARYPITVRQASSIARKHLGRINNLLKEAAGISVALSNARYIASGSGAFGNNGGSDIARRTKPGLVVTQG